MTKKNSIKNSTKNFTETESSPGDFNVRNIDTKLLEKLLDSLVNEQELTRLGENHKKAE